MDKTKKIDNFIKDILKNQPEPEKVKNDLMNMVKKMFPDYNSNQLKNLDFNRTLIEFENWLVSTVMEDPIPGSMKTIWLGLQDANAEKTDVPAPDIQLLVQGTKFSPEEKPNWWEKNIYDPSGKNSEIKAYRTLTNSFKSAPADMKDAMDLLFFSLTATLGIHGFDIIKHEFLFYQPEMIIATGFENGRHIVIGTLNEEGVHPAVN